MPDIEPLGPLFLALVWTVISLYVLYWVIRLGVRHGIRDARDERIGR